MDIHNLTKSQKKVCRELMEAALQRECEKFIESLTNTIAKSKNDGKTPHESYLDLFKRVRNFDKKLQRNFDGVTGSRYFHTVLSLYLQGMLTDEDLKTADEEMHQELIAMSKIFG